MGREWTIKSFKSGNSAALRVPVAAGIAPGQEWLLVEDGDGYRLERIGATAKRKFDVDKIWGIAPDLTPIRPEDRVFEHSPRPWDDPAWPGFADDSQS
jgi:antitoxin VapB